MKKKLFKPWIVLIAVLALAACEIDSLLVELIEEKIEQDDIENPSNASFAVIYDGNGSEGGSVPVDNNTYKTDEIVTVQGNTGNLVKSGYSFTEWNTSANGSGTGYSTGQTFNMGTEDVILYAHWSTEIYGDLTVEERLAIAIELKEEGDLEAALDHLNIIINNYDPSGIPGEVYFEKGNCLNDLGEKQEAFNTYTYIKNNFPGLDIYYEALHELAWLHHIWLGTEGDFTKALEYFYEIIFARPDTVYEARALESIGWNLKSKATPDYSGANAKFDEALAHPHIENLYIYYCLYHKADILILESGDYTGAIAEWEKILYDPTYADALINEYSDSTAFNRVFNLYNTIAWVYYEDLGDFPAAITEWENIINYPYMPDHFRSSAAHDTAKLYWYEYNNYSQSEIYFNDALNYNLGGNPEDSIWIYTDLAHMYRNWMWSVTEPEKAVIADKMLTAADEVISEIFTEPKIDMLILRGEYYLWDVETRDYLSAEDDFQLAISLSIDENLPYEAWARLRLGQLYKDLGWDNRNDPDIDWESYFYDAIALLEVITPGNFPDLYDWMDWIIPEAKANLANSYQGLDDYTQAITILTTLINDTYYSAEDRAGFQSDLVDCYRGLGDYTQAISLLTPLISDPLFSDEDHAWFQLDLGDLYINLGEDYRGNNLYTEALTAFSTAGSEFSAALTKEADVISENQRFIDSANFGIGDSYLLSAWTYNERNDPGDSTLADSAFSAAIPYYEAVSVDGDWRYYWAKRNISHCYQGLGQYANARSTLQFILDNLSTNLEEEDDLRCEIARSYSDEYYDTFSQVAYNSGISAFQYVITNGNTNRYKADAAFGKAELIRNYARENYWAADPQTEYENLINAAIDTYEIAAFITNDFDNYSDTVSDAWREIGHCFRDMAHSYSQSKNWDENNGYLPAIYRSHLEDSLVPFQNAYDSSLGDIESWRINDAKISYINSCINISYSYDLQNDPLTDFQSYVISVMNMGNEILTDTDAHAYYHGEVMLIFGDLNISLRGRNVGGSVFSLEIAEYWFGQIMDDSTYINIDNGRFRAQAYTGLGRIARARGWYLYYNQLDYTGAIASYIDAVAVIENVFTEFQSLEQWVIDDAVRELVDAYFDMSYAYESLSYQLENGGDSVNAAIAMNNAIAAMQAVIDRGVDSHRYDEAVNRKAELEAL